MNKESFTINSKWIVSNRPRRNHVDPMQPYAWMLEKERNAAGELKETGIIFLSNSECSFKCLMCDLWKNTTTKPVPLGAIPGQIQWALDQMPGARQIKLYNSGSFFDQKTIPKEDYPDIAALISGFETVIVEGHPRFINKSAVAFRNLINTELEVAIGLETVHPEVLRKLNKRMEVGDFIRAAAFLHHHKIRTRAFILLRPPFMTEAEGVFWAKRSMELAFESGVDCCTIIPVRPGNGAMDLLMKKGDFNKPSLDSLEEVIDYGISLGSGRVFADTWDLELFSNCPKCLGQRTERLTNMNHKQLLLPSINCTCDADGSHY